MIFKESKLKVVDNSGANLVRCIDVLNKSKRAGSKYGDIVVFSIRTKRLQKNIWKGDIHKGVFIRSKRKFNRISGSSIQFGDNALLIVNNKEIPLGTRIYGPIGQELRWTRHNKIVSMAKLIM